MGNVNYYALQVCGTPDGPDVPAAGDGAGGGSQGGADSSSSSSSPPATSHKHKHRPSIPHGWHNVV